MKQILIATHGKMASGIRYTAELIVGKMDEITTIDAYVTPEDNVEKKFEEYFAQHENDRIFVFTDLMGGSVNQKLLRYSQKENVTLITGTNLPVLMQVMMADDDVTEEEIQEFIDDAREELQMVDLGGGKKSTSEKNAEEDTAQGIENTAQISEGAASYAKKSAPKKALAPQSYDNSTAKITALRVDDRLIHGQVMTQWIQHADANEVVIIDDGVAKDAFIQMIMKSSVPAKINLEIFNVADGIDYLKGEDDGKKILVLVKTPGVLVALADAGVKLESVNVGGIGAKAGRKTLYKNISTSEAENQDLRNLIDKGIKVFFRVVVSDSEELVEKYV